MANAVVAQPGSEPAGPDEGGPEHASGFKVATAWDYLYRATETTSFWKPEEDSVRFALSRLLDQTAVPYDSVLLQLHGFDFRSVPVALTRIPAYDSMQIRWMNDSSFIIDSVGWNLDLLIQRDTILSFQDTVLIQTIDTAALITLEIPLHQYNNGQIIPPVSDPGRSRQIYISPDSGFLVLTDTFLIWMAHRESPFHQLSGEHQLDSLQWALETLLAHNDERDSTRLVINGMYGNRMPFWITAGKSSSHRFWVKNYRNDSITLWIGNPARNEISLLLEDDIDVNRLTRVEPGHLPVDLQEPEPALATISLLKPDPTYWEHEFSSAFTFNQTYLSNWTKGGESSLATMLDMTGSAIYNNKEANTQWINSARINIGNLITGEKGLRKNNDLFEINSKFNRNASGKIGLSASLYLKNQLAKGYNYPNDSVVVSKFLNPASLTIGLGAEYKPFKHTTLNMAPLSYKNTFVLDTALIDQTKHGIARDRRAKQELGTQIVLINTFSPLEDLKISNRLRLFSNYLNHPENIDIDWEMIMDTRINWFFTIRLNLHLIYDDDVRFTVFGSDEQPIILPDGSQKKVAKAQFKEFIGLSLLFKF